MTEYLEKLCAACGVSGREEKVREYILSEIKDFAECSCDNLGNLIVFKKGAETPKKKVMLAAHMDEVGFIITYITDDGFLKIDTVGGIDASVMSGRNVLVGEKLIPGVTGVKPIHLLKDDEKKHYPAVDSMYIDIGAKSKKEAKKYVSQGDCAYFDSDFVRFGDGFLKGRAIDDRAGCAIMIDMIKQELQYDTWFAFTVNEETGHGGAASASFSVAPDCAIILEATTAADIYGAEGDKRVCELSKGPVVSFMDRRTIYPKELYDRAFEIAAQNNIPIQTKSIVAGGNDAGAISQSRAGVKVLAVSLPCRYLHSPSCVIKQSDFEATLKLVRLLTEDFAQK